MEDIGAESVKHRKVISYLATASYISTGIIYSVKSPPFQTSGFYLQRGSALILENESLEQNIVSVAWSLFV